jgi:hypothetical protein
MKKLILFTAALALFSCARKGLTPDPLPEPVDEVVVEDTARRNIINNWTCYQYKYPYGNGETWIIETNWHVKITADTIRIDEHRDGNFERVYPITFAVAQTGSIVTISYPTGTRLYEIRDTRVGKKRGYDLVHEETVTEVISLIK